MALAPQQLGLGITRRFTAEGVDPYATVEWERRDALSRSARAAQQSVNLVLTLYRTGLTDFQNVLDMERSLTQQQDALAQSEGAVSQNLIRIYRSLGGGWTP